MKLWSSRVFDFVISDSGIFGCVEFFKTTLLRRRPPHRLREKESVPVLGLCSREASADLAAEENDASLSDQEGSRIFFGSVAISFESDHITREDL